ncbi:MAG: hypothetical protein OIF57_08855 [Marinobacterium sp.]|nr:hypothetical protein [Marinobacterium sp.]
MPEIGAEVSVADIHSGVKFKTVISGYISKKFTARSIHCFSKNSAVIVTNRADETDITVDNFTGGFNSAGQDDQALLRISGLQYCSVKSLVLADNISRPVSNTQCPVFIEGSADVTGQIKRLSSSANYLRDYLSSDIAKPMSAFTEVSRNDVV